MVTKFQDYYETLGVARTATVEEIRKAHRKLSRQHHPDLNPGDAKAEENFKAVQEAHDVLSDEKKRKLYDQLGENWKAGADFQPPPDWGAGGRQRQEINPEDWQAAFSGGGGEQFSDFFQSLFGGGIPRGQPRAQVRRRGNDVEAELPLTLSEAHRGGTRMVSIQGWERCSDCDGTGVTANRPCAVCGARGQRPVTNSLQVSIPVGMRDGSVLRLSGQGEPGFGGGPAGDLFVRIRLQPDSRFAIEGTDDLLTELPVAPWEAVLGAKVPLATLDGSVEMTVPSGSQTGMRLRLRGQGLSRRDGSRGDLYARLKVVVPTQVSDSERDLFQQLAATSAFRPR